MQSIELNKKDILSNLKNFDNDLRIKNIKIELVIVGGSSLIMKDLISRSTHDIDAFLKEGEKIMGLDQRDLDKLGWEFKINSNAEVYGVDRFVSWEDEFQVIKTSNLKNIKVLLPSDELITMIKLIAASTRERDFKDILWVKEKKKNFNFKKLEKLLYRWYDEIAATKEKMWFNETYEKWVEIIHSED